MSNLKERSINDFQVLSRLGQGSFGQVFKVKRKEDGEIYALKKIKTVTMNQKERENALNEIRILASMNSDYIIGYKDSFYDEGSGHLCIILEFAIQGDVLKKINDCAKQKKHIEEEEIWKAMVQIARGIKSLHDKNILHRDLKSANIFISQDGTYKLGDMNISKVLKQGLAQTQTGTPYYCSPQVWQDKPYGIKSDMWSFGCVLYEMAAQKPPFTASDIQSLYRKISTGIFPRIPNFYSNQLSNTINSLLKLNPTLRPSTSDLLKNSAVKKHIYDKNAFHQPKSMLLETIKFNNRGWKTLNSNLPKSQYGSSNQELQFETSNLQVPVQQRGRPLSSRSGKNYIEMNSGSFIKSTQNSKSPRSNVPRQRLMSAYGKRNLGRSNMSTPEKNKQIVQPESQSKSRKDSQSKNNYLALPPINPAKRVRRGSDNYEVYMMPPKPSDLSRNASRGNSVEKISSNRSKNILQNAGKQIIGDAFNNEVNYKINVVSHQQNKIF